MYPQGYAEEEQPTPWFSSVENLIYWDTSSLTEPTDSEGQEAL